MNTMAPEPMPEAGEEVGLQVDYVWEDDVLTIKTSNGAGSLEVRLDWTVDGADPGADLDLLLSALPQIIINVHQQIGGQS